MLKNAFGSVLQRCARSHIRRTKPYIIGITGSVGKTTSRMVISHILGVSLPEAKVYTSQENFNSEIGLALSILQIPSFAPTFFGSIMALFAGCKRVFFSSPLDVLVLEYGVDTPGDMKELLEICVPHCAIFTGLDLVHAETFGSPDEILQEKILLLQAAKELVLYPSNASYLKDIIENIEVDVLSFGLTTESQSDIGFSTYRLGLDTGGRPFSVMEIDQSHQEVASVQSNLIGEISAGYTSIGIEMAMIISHRMDILLQMPDFLEFPMQSGRFSLFEGIHDSVVIDSTYNASPASMKHAITQTISLRNELYPEHEIIYCLGDMNELGDFSAEEHTKLAGLISQSAEHIYLIGRETLYTHQELQKIGYSSKRVTTCTHARELGALLGEYISSEESKYIILAKSSQSDLYLEESLTPILLHSEDVGFLSRQNNRRRTKKNQFFLEI